MVVARYSNPWIPRPNRTPMDRSSIPSHRIHDACVSPLVSRASMHLRSSASSQIFRLAIVTSMWRDHCTRGVGTLQGFADGSRSGARCAWSPLVLPLKPQSREHVARPPTF